MKSQSQSSSSNSVESEPCRRPSSSARSWSLSQSLLQNATVVDSSSSATASTASEQQSAKKSVVLVKLTDAAIRALEEYVKLANEVRERDSNDVGSAD